MNISEIVKNILENIKKGKSGKVVSGTYLSATKQTKTEIGNNGGADVRGVALDTATMNAIVGGNLVELGFGSSFSQSLRDKRHQNLDYSNRATVREDKNSTSTMQERRILEEKKLSGKKVGQLSSMKDFFSSFSYQPDDAGDVSGQVGLILRDEEEAVGGKDKADYLRVILKDLAASMDSAFRESVDTEIRKRDSFKTFIENPTIENYFSCILEREELLRSVSTKKKKELPPEEVTVAAALMGGVLALRAFCAGQNDPAANKALDTLEYALEPYYLAIMRPDVVSKSKVPVGYSTATFLEQAKEIGKGVLFESWNETLDDGSVHLAAAKIMTRQDDSVVATDAVDGYVQDIANGRRVKEIYWNANKTAVALTVNQEDSLYYIDENGAEKPLFAAEDCVLLNPDGDLDPDTLMRKSLEAIGTTNAAGEPDGLDMRRLYTALYALQHRIAGKPLDKATQFKDRNKIQTFCVEAVAQLFKAKVDQNNPELCEKFINAIIEPLTASYPEAVVLVESGEETYPRDAAVLAIINEALAARAAEDEADDEEVEEIVEEVPVEEDLVDEVVDEDVEELELLDASLLDEARTFNEMYTDEILNTFTTAVEEGEPSEAWENLIEAQVADLLEGASEEEVDDATAAFDDFSRVLVNALLTMITDDDFIASIYDTDALGEDRIVKKDFYSRFTAKKELVDSAVSDVIEELEVDSPEIERKTRTYLEKIFKQSYELQEATLDEVLPKLLARKARLNGLEDEEVLEHYASRREAMDEFIGQKVDEVTTTPRVLVENLVLMGKEFLKEEGLVSGAEVEIEGDLEGAERIVVPPADFNSVRKSLFGDAVTEEEVPEEIVEETAEEVVEEPEIASELENVEETEEVVDEVAPEAMEEDDEDNITPVFIPPADFASVRKFLSGENEEEQQNTEEPNAAVVNTEEDLTPVSQEQVDEVAENLSAENALDEEGERTAAISRIVSTIAAAAQERAAAEEQRRISHEIYEKLIAGEFERKITPEEDAPDNQDEQEETSEGIVKNETVVTLVDQDNVDAVEEELGEEGQEQELSPEERAAAERAAAEEQRRISHEIYEKLIAGEFERKITPEEGAPDNQDEQEENSEGIVKNETVVTLVDQDNVDAVEEEIAGGGQGQTLVEGNAEEEETSAEKLAFEKIQMIFEDAIFERSDEFAGAAPIDEKYFYTVAKMFSIAKDLDEEGLFDVKGVQSSNDRLEIHDFVEGSPAAEQHKKNREQYVVDNMEEFIEETNIDYIIGHFPARDESLDKEILKKLCIDAMEGLNKLLKDNYSTLFGAIARERTAEQAHSENRIKQEAEEIVSALTIAGPSDEMRDDEDSEDNSDINVENPEIEIVDNIEQNVGDNAESNENDGVIENSDNADGIEDEQSDELVETSQEIETTTQNNEDGNANADNTNKSKKQGKDEINGEIGIGEADPFAASSIIKSEQLAKPPKQFKTKLLRSIGARLYTKANDAIVESEELSDEQRVTVRQNSAAVGLLISEDAFVQIAEKYKQQKFVDNGDGTFMFVKPSKKATQTEDAVIGKALADLLTRRHVSDDERQIIYDLFTKLEESRGRVDIDQLADEIAESLLGKISGSVRKEAAQTVVPAVQEQESAEESSSGKQLSIEDVENGSQSEDDEAE